MGNSKDLSRFRSLWVLGPIASLATLIALVLAVPNEYRGYVLALVLAIVLVLTLWFVRELFSDRFSLRISGLTRFLESFPPDHNGRILDLVQEEYCYLGVSFAQLHLLTHWYRNAPRFAKVKLLLTDPEARDCLRFQACHASREAAPHDEKAAAVMGQFKAGIDRVRSWRKELGTDADVTVRHHSERLRKWMCIVDRRTIYIGLLGKGRSDGSEPVMVLSAGQKGWNLFNYYLEEWDSLWQDAEVIGPESGRAMNAALLKAEVAKNPDVKMRIGLLERLDALSGTEIEECVEVLLGEDFLRYTSEEVRGATAALLARCESRIRSMRREIRSRLEYLMTGDLCVRVQLACVDAFLQYFDGDDFFPLARGVWHADANPDLNLWEMRDKCLTAVFQAKTSKASEVLVKIVSRGSRETQEECLREIRERKAKGVYQDLLEVIQHNQLHRDHFWLAVSTLYDLNPRRARALVRMPGLPAGFMEKVNEYFGSKDGGPNEEPDALVAG